jgi:hypothetical protein
MLVATKWCQPKSKSQESKPKPLVFTLQIKQPHNIDQNKHSQFQCHLNWT